MSEITVTLVMNDDGSVNQMDSQEAFDTALANFLAERETETSTIAEAVSAVFDAPQHMGKRIKMDHLTSLTLNHLNAQLENYSTLQQRVKEYVRANSKGDNSLLVIGKGAGGGVGRRADLPVKPVDESK